jgi:hypothetical protein
MNNNYDACRSVHQLAGCYEALTELAVTYLKIGPAEKREFFANYLEERLAQLKEDYNTIYNVKKSK